MKAAVIRFPGSNCDQDCFHALNDVFGVETHYVWHKETSLDAFDLIVLPGGFSYGDYLRCGAIARYSPVMKSLVEQAEKGKHIMGICNGFQILCEAHLLPGALVRNRSLHFICEHVKVRVESVASSFTSEALTGQSLNIPIAHGEGNYTADEATLHALNKNKQILLRYVDDNGAITDAANPNGSAENIAGIRNERGNVFGLMPHPERACDALLGSEDGKFIFESVLVSAGFIKAKI
ncbi:MAG: phosphoribosylformylglycinamidine synthase subunit PurQ [Chthoniobacteraceae bacterium]